MRLQSVSTVLVGSPDVWNGGVKSLSAQQVRDIYEKKITNWSDVGGPELLITFYNKEPGRGTWEVIANVSSKQPLWRIPINSHKTWICIFVINQNTILPPPIQVVFHSQRRCSSNPSMVGESQTPRNRSGVCRDSFALCCCQSSVGDHQLSPCRDTYSRE